MPRQIFTADDIIQLARVQKSDVLLLGADDVVTSEAEDAAQKLGLRLVREKAGGKPNIERSSQNIESGQLPPLKKVSGLGLTLDPFGADVKGTTARVGLKDVITSADRSPMAAGYMTLEQGEFPWTLTYDEIDIVLEGELVITRGAEMVRGGPGDVIFIPKGSSIKFGTPSKARFVYVTYPADWANE